MRVEVEAHQGEVRRRLGDILRCIAGLACREGATQEEVARAVALLQPLGSPALLADPDLSKAAAAGGRRPPEPMQHHAMQTLLLDFERYYAEVLMPDLVRRIEEVLVEGGT